MPFSTHNSCKRVCTQMLIFDASASYLDTRNKICISRRRRETPDSRHPLSLALATCSTYVHEMSLFKLRKSVVHDLAYIKEVPTEKDHRSDSLETPDM